MANDIENKELWKVLGNIGQKHWITAAPLLGINVAKSNKGTSHFINLRDPKISDTQDIRGLVSTITPNCFKQTNQKIFKRVLEFCKKNGKTEEDIWRALGLMK
jgi:hypothetical protein